MNITKIPAFIHLFARPSFWTGFARIVDPFGTLNKYNISATSKEADDDAMYADWKAVGQDMWHGVKEYKNKRA